MIKNQIQTFSSVFVALTDKGKPFKRRVGTKAFNLKDFWMRNSDFLQSTFCNPVWLGCRNMVTMIRCISHNPLFQSLIKVGMRLLEVEPKKLQQGGKKCIPI